MQAFTIGATSIAWFVCVIAGAASIRAYIDSQSGHDTFAISGIFSVISGFVAIGAGVLGAIGSAVLWFGGQP